MIGTAIAKAGIAKLWWGRVWKPVRVYSFRRASIAALLHGLLFIAAQLAAAQTETVIYSFTGSTDGSHPIGDLVQDKQGNLYGTTSQGGGSGCGGLGCGTVFEVTVGGEETVLYRFAGTPDAATPYAGLTLDDQGNLYGTTLSGGDFGDGTVFEVRSTGEEIVLHSFDGGDGAGPEAGLVRDGEGNLYGATQYGGSSYGTVFKLTPDGTLTVLYSFSGGIDGGAPLGNLILDRKGNLYGTTADGGAFRLGTVFEVTREGLERVIYSFAGGADGISPFDGVIRDKAGNLYGTTLGGGGSANAGTVFEVSPTGVGTVLYTFTGQADGGSPRGGLSWDANGNLCGTTTMGGSLFNGAIFSISRAGVETVLHNFARGSDGALPEAGLVRGTKKTLYGTTYYGGTTDGGTVFKLIP